MVLNQRERKEKRREGKDTTTESPLGEEVSGFYRWSLKTLIAKDPDLDLHFLVTITRFKSRLRTRESNRDSLRIQVII